MKNKLYVSMFAFNSFRYYTPQCCFFWMNVGTLYFLCFFPPFAELISFFEEMYAQMLAFLFVCTCDCNNFHPYVQASSDSI